MNQAKGSPDDKTPCDICRRLVAPPEIEYDYQTGQKLCAKCLAEERNCSCSDD